MISYARLRKLLKYDRRTGIFTWRVNGGGRYMRVGARAGTIRELGYRQIFIDGRSYRAARLAVFYVTGRWPQRLVDHRNSITDDDRWQNLRQATSAQNAHNMRIKNKNKVGFKGVVLCKLTGRYRAFIKINYRSIHLGRFDTPQQANDAYLAAAKRYFGTFARAK